MEIPDHVLDCRDDLCPGPVIKVAKTLKTLAVNQVLEVHATDPGALPDMEALAKQTGQQILGVAQEADYVRILIRRLR
ncbi:MAG: sulfurtransferase TusA family protein [Candidatus Rokubacteria bacterium]|nr:sulfurtransferase TusA family protein [Candidatus Rokubacteria bacterium]